MKKLKITDRFSVYWSEPIGCLGIWDNQKDQPTGVMFEHINKYSLEQIGSKLTVAVGLCDDVPFFLNELAKHHPESILDKLIAPIEPTKDIITQAREHDLDKFAIAAMQAIISHDGRGPSIEVIAIESYNQAETMIAERDKRIAAMAQNKQL